MKLKRKLYDEEERFWPTSSRHLEILILKRAKFEKRRLKIIACRPFSRDKYL